MKNKLKNLLGKRYGLPTAICMVIGTIIGSGVFFKAERVLSSTHGDLKLGILAWLVGAFIMLVSAYTFSLMAEKYSFVNGAVDYAENFVGPRYAYMFGWFMTAIFTPALSSVLAWVSARYLCTILGYSITGGECLAISGLFLVCSFVLNTLSPKISAKFQISTTVIKLVPILLMGIVGIFAGLKSGMLNQNFNYIEVEAKGKELSNFLTAIVATAFAYEGWIFCTSINSELRNPKRDLPLALVAGTMVVAIMYTLYYLGLSGVVENKVLMSSGENGTILAFTTIFGKFAGIALMVFVVISCLGTLNGLMLSGVRGAYSLAARKQGIRPDIFGNVDKVTYMPTNSCVVGLLISEFWLFYFYGANLTDWFAPFRFDSSEIAIVTIYAMYIPIYICFMKKSKDKNVFKHYIAPILSILGALFMVYASFYAHGMGVFYYLIIFAIIMFAGYIYGKKSKVFK